MGGLLCVELEQVRDDLLLVTVEVNAIGCLNSRVERSVGFEKLRIHTLIIGFIELCESRSLI